MGGVGEAVVEDVVAVEHTEVTVGVAQGNYFWPLQQDFWDRCLSKYALKHCFSFPAGFFVLRFICLVINVRRLV